MDIKRLTLALLLSALFLPGLSAQVQDYRGSDPQGTVSYALPQTVLSFEVTARKEQFFAGPYARYAKKYLGIDARTQDAVSYEIVSVGMTPLIEADQTRRFLVTPGKDASTFLQMTSQGLVSVNDGSFGRTSAWRFPSSADGDFSLRGVSSNLTSESATLSRVVKNDAAFNTVAVRQDMVVQKSAEQRAQEAADMVFSLRKKLVEIVTGDTDATYSGEAMAAAIAEITRLEQEYLSLFTGYSEYSEQTGKFDVIPSRDAKSQTYVAFRLSESDGLVSSDNMTGKPYLVELVPQPVASSQGVAPKNLKGSVAVYRIPAVCSVKLSDGVNVLLQDRVPVYQLGAESTFTLMSK